jgi:hypothetical protein
MLSHLFFNTLFVLSINIIVVFFYYFTCDEILYSSNQRFSIPNRSFVCKAKEGRYIRIEFLYLFNFLLLIFHFRQKLCPIEHLDLMNVAVTHLMLILMVMR